MPQAVGAFVGVGDGTGSAAICIGAVIDIRIEHIF